MSEPLDALITWIVADAKAAATAAGDNVVDDVPDDDPYPRIHVEGARVIKGADSNKTCGRSWEVLQTLAVYSQAVGYPECEGIAKTLEDRFDEAEPVLAGFRVPVFEWLGTTYDRRPDGLTSVARLEFRILIDEA